MLGRLRGYKKTGRDSTFDYNGIKRLGDYDDSNDKWHRYHWCERDLLGYKDDTNTYYFLCEPDGSVEVIFTHAGAVVNRLEYDFLGKLRNKTTDPQVELGWRKMFFINEEIEFYIFGIQPACHFPIFGKTLNLKNSNIRLEIIYELFYPIVNNQNNSHIMTVWDRFSDWFCRKWPAYCNGLGSHSHWNPDGTYIIEDPNHAGECCLAYGIDEDGMPTGYCALWGPCY